MPPPKKNVHKKNPGKPKIFIVHGHKQLEREMVARFLQSLECEPIILDERPNQGKTLAEKFNYHSDVEFAVVLMTGDDLGGPANVPFGQQRKRARQNVILELGFFLAKLGSENVCVLYEKEVEIPSDYQGVYIKFEGTWKDDLIRELKSSNITIKT